MHYAIFSGPNIEPRGTPTDISLKLELKSSMLTNYMQSVKEILLEIGFIKEMRTT